MPQDRIDEIEDFVGFVSARENDRQLSPDFTKLSEEVFERIWDNPEDAVYDNL